MSRTQVTSSKFPTSKKLCAFGVLVFGALVLHLIYENVRDGFETMVEKMVQKKLKTLSQDVPMCSIQTALRGSPWDLPPSDLKDECRNASKPLRNLQRFHNRDGRKNMDVHSSDFVEFQKVPYFTDDPRNQTTIDFTAEDWEHGLTRYRNMGTPTDALWMPISPWPMSCGKHPTKSHTRRDGKKQHKRSDVVGLFVYSAYLETRFPNGHLGVFVRVLGIIGVKVCRLSCRFGYQQAGFHQEDMVEAEVEWQWPHAHENLGLPFREVFINCPLPRRQNVLPVSVSVFHHLGEGDESRCSHISRLPGNMVRVITGSRQGTPEKPQAFSSSWEVDKKASFAFCVRHMWNNFKDVVQLVEFIELHTILGVTDFYLYGHTYSKEVKCVLQEYYQQDIFKNETGAEVYFLNYELPFRPNLELHEAGPATPMNDCLYRSMAAGTHYVANGDLDDILLPVALKGRGALYETMFSLSRHDPNAGSFEFVRFEAPRNHPDDESYSSPIRLRTMRKTQREEQSRVFPKLVVIPERVTGLRTHWLRSAGLLPGHHQCGVNAASVAYANHYRLHSPGPDKLKGGELSRLIIDRNAHAYGDILNERVGKFLDNVLEECNVKEDLWNSDVP